ncbi:MAG: transcriptional regulator FtrA [Pseudolabrys sp.]
MTMIVMIMPKRSDAGKPHAVVALAYDSLCTFEFGVTYEVFGNEGGEGGPRYTFRTAAVERGRLRADSGLVVGADGGAALLAKAQTVIVPGWRPPHHEVPECIADALRTAHRRGARIVSICTGAYVLAAAGLLDGRRATTHWQCGADFSRRYPAVQFQPDVLYVDEGDILTSAGSASGIDLCLHIVRKDLGPEAANAAARRLVVPPHRQGGQAQFVQRPAIPEQRNRLSALLDWMRGALDRDLTLARLAARAGMSPRTFYRRFFEATGATPAEWVLCERLAHARDLLETTTAGIEEVAARAGFGSAAALRQHFRRRLATTPTLYRTQFARPPKRATRRRA